MIRHLFFILTILCASNACLGAQHVPAAQQSLLHIFELAFKNDAQLQKEHHNINAEQEILAQSRTVLKPSVDIDAEITHSKVKEDDDDEDIDRNGISRVYALNARQPLFKMSAWYQYQKAKATFSQLDEQRRQIVQDFIVRMMTAYLQVLRAQVNLTLALAEEKSVHQQLEQTQQRFSVGLIAVTEVHEAQAVYDTAQANLLAAQNDLTIAQTNLGTLTGILIEKPPELKENFPITNPQPASEADWIDLALMHNPRLIAAQHAKNATHSEKKAARSSNLPTLDLTSRLARNTGFQSGFDFPDQDTLSIGLELSVPIYHGGAYSSYNRQTTQRYLAAKDEIIFQTRLVKQNIHNFYATVITDVKRVKARGQSILSSESALEATRAGYDVGTRNIVDVLQAQRQLFSARRDYANARYDYIAHSLALRQEAGTLDLATIKELDPWFE